MDDLTETDFWHVRVTLPHTKKPKILDLMKSLESPYFLAAEISDAGVEHFHCIIKIQNRKWWKERLDELGVPPGNSGRMCSKLRESFARSIGYLFKDNDYSTEGFSKDILKAAEDVFLEFQTKQKKKEKTVLQQLRDNITKKLEKIKLDSGNEVFLESYGRIVNKEFILDQVLEFYQQSKSLIREFYIVSVVQTLCLEFVPSYDYEFRNRILEKI